jgi:hypothetical protein
VARNKSQFPQVAVVGGTPYQFSYFEFIHSLSPTMQEDSEVLYPPPKHQRGYHRLDRFFAEPSYQRNLNLAVTSKPAYFVSPTIGNISKDYRQAACEHLKPRISPKEIPHSFTFDCNFHFLFPYFKPGPD